MPSIKGVSQVKENGKLYLRARAILSEDTKSSLEAGETSFGVYYGTTGAAVPFMWESQPGTPKHPIFDKYHDENDHSIPPLTPPPSYISSSSLGSSHLSSEKPRKTRFLDAILSSISRKSSHVSPTSTLSWSTSSSSSSSLSSPRSSTTARKKINIKSYRRSLSLNSSRAKSRVFGDEGHESVESPLSMCFWFKKGKQGCYSIQDMKDAIVSITKH